MSPKDDKTTFEEKDFSECMRNYFPQAFNFQGFLGFTSANKVQPNNNIDLIMVDFLNLNPDYYSDTTHLEKRDYFRVDMKRQYQAIQQELNNNSEGIAN